MLSKQIAGLIIGITAIVLVLSLFAYPDSKPSQTTTQTFADLLKEGEVEKFNELRKDWNGKLEFADIDHVAISISKYKKCMKGNHA